jgi:HK97 family phage major capsid protein
MNLREAREKREETLETMDNILVLADSEEGRDLTEDENTEYKSLDSEVEKLDSKIEILEKQESRKKEIAKKNLEEEARRATALAGGAGSEDEDKSDTKELLKMSRKFSLAKAVRMYSGLEKRQGVEDELSEEARKEALGGGADFGYEGMGIPGSVLRAEWQASEKRTDIDQATSAIQPTAVGRYVEAIRQNAVFSQVIPGANILTGLTGDFKIPSVGSQSLAWATAENSAAADGGANFGKDTLSPIRLTGYADVSDKVLIQNGDVAMNMIMSDFGRESANKVDGALFSTADVANAIPAIAATSGVLTFTETAVYAAPSSTVNGSVYDDALLALQTLANGDSANGALAFVGHTKLMSDLIKSPKVLSVSGAAEAMDLGAPIKLIVNGVPFFLTTSNTSNAGVSADFIGGNFNFEYVGMFGGLDISVDPWSSKLNAQKRVVIHRWLDAGLLRGAGMVKSTTLLS